MQVGKELLELLIGWGRDVVCSCFDEVEGEEEGEEEGGLVALIIAHVWQEL